MYRKANKFGGHIATGKRYHTSESYRAIKKKRSYDDPIRENELRKANPRNYRCILCGDGIFLIRQGKFGQFQSCSNFPKCLNAKSI